VGLGEDIYDDERAIKPPPTKSRPTKIQQQIETAKAEAAKNGAKSVQK
jgi:hypothetical protein